MAGRLRRAGRDEPERPQDVRLRWIVEDGETVGYARLASREDREPGRYHLDVLVHPDRRGQGIGGGLWLCAAGEFHRLGVGQLRDNDPASLAFAQARGFATLSHLCESVLDPEGFDVTAFPTSEGVRVVSMADVPDDATHRRKLWRLNDWDIDEGRCDCRTFEQFERDIFEGYW